MCASHGSQSECVEVKASIHHCNGVTMSRVRWRDFDNMVDEKDIELKVRRSGGYTF